jgi:CBS domain-containing protein
MLIEDTMKRFVVSIDTSNTVRQAAGLMVDRHVGTLPVVDGSGRLTGLLTLADVLQLFLPDFTRLFDEIDFVVDFGALEEPRPRQGVMNMNVAEVMRPPEYIVKGTGLMRAWASIQKSPMSDIPVVDEEGQLLGIASRVDIGTGFLADWLAE